MRVRIFKPQFAPLVLNGTKRQTIRPTPKRMPKVGDKESWRKWSDKPYRSPQIELIKVVLAGVLRIKIVGYGMIILNDKDCTWNEAQEIARLDGFESLHDMMTWFLSNHGLPFEGILIKAT